MPIYEFTCPKCRVVFNFLSKRVNPGRLPACPKCGNKKMAKQMSRFTMPRPTRADSADAEGEPPVPGMDDTKVMRAMAKLERDLGHMDENNPRHMAHLMRKMKEAMPPGTTPKEMDVAIKRLEAGEDPEKIEADMGDVFGDMLDGPEGRDASTGNYTRDSGLYDY